MHPEDVAMGFKRRRVELRAKKPDNLEVKFYSGNTMADLKLTETKVLKSLKCDGCGVPILDGEKAIAVTMWRGDEPAPWEQDYQ